jgi:hypothetical protein
MKSWLQWPIKSGSPATDATILVILFFAFILALFLGGMILVPIGIAIGIVKAVQWYTNRPVPTDQLYADTEQRSISANFPNAEQFIDSHIDRLLDASRENLPTHHVFQVMTEIAADLYKEERLSNPLPPLPPANTIEERRYRDLLIAHQRKTVDAPRTLETFHATLGTAFIDFIGELPSIAKTTPQEFSKTNESD